MHKMKHLKFGYFLLYVKACMAIRIYIYISTDIHGVYADRDTVELCRLAVEAY